MEKFAMADGTALRYSDFGKGEKVLVLIHGYMESLEVFDSFAGVLGKQYRVICVDLPGHGFSQWQDREVITVDYSADTVAALLIKIGVTRATVIGHSMGGYVAVAMAQRHGELLEGLVLLHSSPSGDTPDKKEFRLREIAAIEAGKKEMLATVNPGRGFAPMNQRRLSDRIDELSEQIMITEDAAIIATLKGLMEREDRTDFFASTPIARLMIFGKWDNYIPIEAAEAMIEKFPTAQHAWLENSGHNSFLEEPDKVVDIIREFVK